MAPSWLSWGSSKDQYEAVKREDADAIGVIKNTADSGAFTGVDPADVDLDASRSAFERSMENRKLASKGDARAGYFDVDSISSLEARYSKELAVADERMQNRKEKEKKSFRNGPDYDNDYRFQQWKKDQANLMEKLGIHWIDKIMDHPLEMLIYTARVGTTVGLFYGCGRTAYLYKTMDKVYAKLNGVSIGGLLVQEVSTGVLKGALVSFGCTVGAVIGDSASKVVSVVVSGDVQAPERTWHHVWATATLSGLSGGVVFAGLHRQLFSPWGMGFVVGASTLLASAVGFYAGYAVYRPFAAKRLHRYDDPYWRPWHERKIMPEGARQIRGKYM